MACERFQLCGSTRGWRAAWRCGARAARALNEPAGRTAPARADRGKVAQHMHRLLMFEKSSRVYQPTAAARSHSRFASLWSPPFGSTHKT